MNGNCYKISSNWFGSYNVRAWNEFNYPRLQNGTLAAFVGTQIFDGSSMVFIVPAAAYALIMMVTSIIFIFIIRKNT